MVQRPVPEPVLIPVPNVFLELSRTMVYQGFKSGLPQASQDMLKVGNELLLVLSG